MGCLLFKESKLNFLENLKTEGYINSRRELTFEKDVHKYLNDLVNRLNLNYDLNLKALATIKEVKIKTGKDFSRDSEKFILTPIEESFEQIDNRRKELGIYEDRISIGEYNKTQGEKISNQEEINLNSFNGGEALLKQEEREGGLEANLKIFSELKQELRVREGEILSNNNKILGFNILSENSVINKDVSTEQAKIIFNKKNRNNQEKKDLSVYFANYFLNSVYDKEGLLHLGYDRFSRYGITSPKLLIVQDNGRKNPFFQYNNVVIIGLKQLEKFINSLKTPSFEKFENLINTVAQEEIIHLYADYLLDYQDIDNIYNEMTEKDINQIKKIYGNSSIQKENIVHEYVRMVVQQRVFGKTTEYETFTLSNAIMSFFGNLLEELNDFLSTIIGSTNTQKAIEDVINFTKGNFSEELDDKIVNRVFNKGQILEANLNVLNNFQEEQKELDKIVDKINNESKQLDLFEFFQKVSDSSFQQFHQSLNKPNTNPILQGNQKPDVILPIGTSGSGKSTFIKSLPQDNLVVIEPDVMRVEFTGDMNDKSKDKEIYEEAAKRAIAAIKQGKQVVFDTTNLTKEKRLPFIKAIKEKIPNANIQYKLMELNPELAKQRIKADIAAGKNRANVPDATIDRHAESYKQMLEDIKSEPISNFDVQQEQAKKFAELQERLNNKEFLEGTKNVFESSEELQNVYYEVAGFNKPLDFYEGDTLKIDDKTYTISEKISSKELAKRNGLTISSNVPVYIVNEPLGLRKGGYDTVNNIIILSKNSDKETIHHELIHSVEYNLDKKEIEPLYQKVKNTITEDSFNDFVSWNFKKSISEFIADALSKKVFRDALKKEGLLEEIDNILSVYNQQITPQQKLDALNAYTDYIARVSLGIIKNPSSGEYNYESKVRDIVYRGGNLGTKQPQDVEAFTTNKSYAKYRAEQNNTQVYPAILNIQESKLLDKKEIRTLSLDRDEFEYQDYGFTDNKDQTKQLGNFYTIKENNRHILGSKTDIEGFKEFVQGEKDDLKPFIDESNKIGDESINERLKKYEESIKIPNSVRSKVLEKIEKETEKVKEKLLSLGLKQEGNKFELITNSYATFRMKLKELENVNVIISTNKTSDFYQIIARLKNVDSTMELKKQGELPFTPIEVKQVIQEQQFLNDVADNVFEELSEEEKQILKKKIENGDYNLNCKI